MFPVSRSQAAVGLDTLVNSTVLPDVLANGSATLSSWLTPLVLTNPVHVWPPGYGPGTEFAKVTAELGITAPENCSCKALMVQMDMWGVSGCRQRKDEIVQKIKANAGKWGWSDKLANYPRAAWNSLVTGLALKINPLDPIPGLVEVAIQRAAN